MNRFNLLIAIGLMGGVCSIAMPASAYFVQDHSDLSFEEGMDRILDGYLAVYEKLIKNEPDGVPLLTRRLAVIIKQLNRAQGSSQFAPHFKRTKRRMNGHARQLMKAQSIDEMRSIFHKLSIPLIDWVTSSKPLGVAVVHCQVAQASWVQLHGPIRNPYFGDKLLESGTIVGGGKSIEETLKEEK